MLLFLSRLEVKTRIQDVIVVRVGQSDVDRAVKGILKIVEDAKMTRLSAVM
jgi:hypothetical protein